MKTPKESRTEPPFLYDRKRNPMNCFVLAAGNGMRLRPLTEDTQKCMLPVAGKPMLKWWLDAVFESDCFNNVYVNIHHCADAVELWLDKYFVNTGFVPKVIDERSCLLGTAGTLFWHGDDSQDFMLAYSDTFSEKIFFRDYYLRKLKAIWTIMPDSIMVGLIGFDIPSDGSAGAIAMDEFGNVTGFKEKSSAGEIAWSGLMFAKKELFDEIKITDKDLARDVFPRLIGKMRVIAKIDAYDIGRGLEQYEHLNWKLSKTGIHTR